MLKWSDGSVENDLPMTRLSELFNVNHFIVSQGKSTGTTTDSLFHRINAPMCSQSARDTVLGHFGQF